MRNPGFEASLRYDHQYQVYTSKDEFILLNTASISADGIRVDSVLECELILKPTTIKVQLKVVEEKTQNIIPDATTSITDYQLGWDTTLITDQNGLVSLKVDRNKDYWAHDAKIGENVQIGPFSTIYGDVEIGDGTWIGPNAVIMDGARIGKNCKIYPGAVISAVSQDLKYKGEYTTTHIGDNTTIRECVTIHKGTADRLKTVIGSNCLLMAYVHVAHDCLIGNNVIIANSTQLAGHITIGDWVIIEGMVGTQQFVNIGSHSFIAGMSSVRKNVPPYVKAAREPLSYVGVNTVGLRRRGFSDEQIMNIEDIYRVIYVQNSNITAALKIADIELPQSEEKETILDFIRSSTKGIMRGLS